jgi:hypothetical protein
VLRGRARKAPAPRPSGRDGPPEPPDVRELCREAGWEFTERASGTLSVGLDAGKGACRALIGHGPGRPVRLAVELAAGRALTPAARRAVGLLGLRAGAIVRMVRGAVEEDGSDAEAEPSGPDRRSRNAAVRLEVVLGPAPTPARIDHALSALSVAWRMCGREALALCGQRAAKEYLSVRGWSP